MDANSDPLQQNWYAFVTSCRVTIGETDMVIAVAFEALSEGLAKSVIVPGIPR